MVEIADQVVLAEWQFRFFEAGIVVFNSIVESVPLIIHRDTLGEFLLNAVDLPLLLLHLKGIFERDWVNLLEDGLKSDEGLLQDLVPVVIGQVDDHRHQHWEGLLFVCFQDVEEVVVLKEAHGAISHLQMVTADALDDTFEKTGDQVLDSLNLTDFKDFLELSEEKCLLDTVGEGPVLEEAFKERDC